MENKLSGGVQAIHFVKAFVISALLTVLMLLFCAFLLLKTGMEDKVLHILLAAVDALAVFVGGLYLGKKAGQQKFLWGLIFGILYFLIYLIFAFIISGTELAWTGVLKSFLVMSVSGMIGGMIS